MSGLTSAEHTACRQAPRITRSEFFSNVMTEVAATVRKVLAGDGPQAVFINCHSGRTFHTGDLSKAETERIHMYVGTVYRTEDTRIDAYNFALVRDDDVREHAMLSAWRAYEARECGRATACVPEITAGRHPGMTRKTNGG